MAVQQQIDEGTADLQVVDAEFPQKRRQHGLEETHLLFRRAHVEAEGGYATNVGVIGQLVGPKDLIISDQVVHNSAVMGSVLSGAARRSFPHNDLDALAHLLTTSRSKFERVLIVVEGLYSMDGDFPDLPRLIEIKRRHHAWLMIDEAHSLGVLGRRGYGIAEHFDVDPRDVERGLTRYEQLRTSLGIAPNILSRRLAALTEAGLLEKRRYSQRPPRDEYVLTNAGRDFLPILMAIGAWGRKYNGAGALSQHFDTETGEAVRPVVVDANTGAPIGTRPLRFELPV